MLTAYYDLALCPPTYDFVSFLLHVECERRKRGEETVEVVFLPGPAGGFRRDSLWPHSVEERQGLLRNVAMPMCELLPSCVCINEAIKRPKPAPNSIGYAQRLYGLPVYVKAMREGGPTLRAPNPKPDPKLVTITLRECKHWPERNSNTAEWIKAARAIEARGYQVTVIRDTLRATEPLPGCITSPAAAIDLIERANLYASAVCNLAVSTGPIWLAVALGVPVLIFRPVTDSSANPAARSSHFVASGIARGGQMPGALPGQTLVWEPDECERIVRAFDGR